MIVKISRRFKGNEYLFKIEVSVGTNICSVRQYGTDRIISGKIYPDFKTICLSDSVWLESLNGVIHKEINYLSINKWKVNDIKEYVTASL